MAMIRKMMVIIIFIYENAMTNDDNEDEQAWATTATWVMTTVVKCAFSH